MKEHVLPAALALGHGCGGPGGSTRALEAFSVYALLNLPENLSFPWQGRGGGEGIRLLPLSRK